MRRVLVGLVLALGIAVTPHSVASDAARLGTTAIERHGGPRDIDGGQVVTTSGDASVVGRDGPVQPRTSGESSPPYPMIVLATVFVAGGCLYLLFRRGSIAYRARADDGDQT